MADKALSVEFVFGGTQRTTKMAAQGHPILAKMKARHYQSMWHSINKEIKRFTEKQFDTGGSADRGETWRGLKDSTREARAKHRGYYEQPSAEGPSYRIGVWTVGMRNRFMMAPYRIGRMGLHFQKIVRMPRAVVFHHGRKDPPIQPRRRVWNTLGMRKIVVKAWNEWMDWASRNVFQ